MAASGSFVFGPFRLDTVARALWVDETCVETEGQEYNVLELLVAHAGQVITREQHGQKLWGYTPAKNTWTQAIRRTRLLLKSYSDEKYIQTVNNVGYRFVYPLLPEEGTENRTPAPPMSLPAGRAVSRWAVLSDKLHPHFTGRTPFLVEDIQHAFQRHARRVVVLHGLPGVGKTQLALAYAARYPRVWWIRAEKPSTLEADYMALAPYLSSIDPGEGPGATLVTQVRSWLERHEDWLLVFDNVVDSGAIEPYLPRQATGDVLLTSRNPVWRSSAEPLQVPLWEVAEAVAFLYARTGRSRASDSEGDATALVQHLGCLPLALEQAGAYIDALGITFAAYVRKLEQRGAKFQRAEARYLRRSGHLPTSYPLTTLTTWALARHEVRKTSAAAAALLTLCAVMAPEEIPLAVFHHGAAHLPPRLAALVSDPEALDQAVGLLRRYALVARHGEMLTMHRVPQSVLWACLPSETARRRWITRALAVLSAALTLVHVPEASAQAQAQSWHLAAGLWPHGLAVALRAEEVRPLPPTLSYLRQELDVLLQTAEVMVALQGNTAPAVAEVYRRAQDVCTQLGDELHLSRPLFGLWAFHTFRGDFAEAGVLGERLYRLARASAYEGLAALSVGLAMVQCLRGDFLRADQLIEEALQGETALRAYRPPYPGGFHPLVGAWAFSALTRCTLGYPEEARQRTKEALARAEEMQHPVSQAAAASWAAMLHMFYGEHARTQAYADQGLRLATTHKFPMWEAHCRVLRGWAIGMQGNHEAGKAEITKGMDTLERQGFTAEQSRLLAMRAEVELDEGQVAEARADLEKAMDLARHRDEHCWEVEICRLQGEMWLRHEPPDMGMAQQCLRDGLALAERQQAPWWALRVAVRLGHLLHQHGQRDEARACVAAIYRQVRVSEGGFQTPDLEAAQGFLADLG